MLKRTNGAWGWVGGSVLAGMLLVMAGGCHNGEPAAGQPAVERAAQPQSGQLSFSTQDDAVKALAAAVQTAAQSQDKTALRQVLGAESAKLASGDAVEDAHAMKIFAQRAREGTRVEQKDARTAIVYVGKQEWPFPIPLVLSEQDRWFFDTPAGEARILARRIGRNELEAIEVCRTYVQAQREYASMDHDGSGVLKYAQHLLSRPEQQDGLYWPTAEGERPSPLGPLMAQASEEGYVTERGHGRQPFHGYYYRILKQQGSNAPGGRYDYVINGNMIAGFALIAWPAEYGSSGIMSFMVSHQGKVYQKDLGAKTERIARGIRAYNPDSGWAVVGSETESRE